MKLEDRQVRELKQQLKTEREKVRQLGKLLAAQARNVTNDRDVTEDNYFGVCPACGRTDGCLNIGRVHWFVCHQHKKKWSVGSNLFSSWRDQTEADWEANFHRIKDYEDIGAQGTCADSTQEIEIVQPSSVAMNKGKLLLDAAKAPVKRFLELYGDTDWRGGGLTYELSRCGTPVLILIHEGTQKKDAILMLLQLLACVSEDWERLVSEDWDETHDDWSAIEEPIPF